jgi:hypothetical protein
MAWVNPVEVAAGDPLTETLWNQDVVANATALRGDYATSRRTSGNLTLNNTSWANVDNGLDLTLAADAGDVIEAVISGLWNTAAVFNFLDVVTVVSGSPVNSFASGSAVAASTGEGVMSWYAPQNLINPVGGPAFYKLVADDVSGGNVVLRLRFRSSSGTNRDLLANASNPLVFVARNHGPVEI